MNIFRTNTTARLHSFGFESNNDEYENVHCCVGLVARWCWSISLRSDTRGQERASALYIRDWKTSTEKPNNNKNHTNDGVKAKYGWNIVFVLGYTCACRRKRRSSDGFYFIFHPNQPTWNTKKLMEGIRARLMENFHIFTPFFGCTGWFNGIFIVEDPHLDLKRSPKLIFLCFRTVQVRGKYNWWCQGEMMMMHWQSRKSVTDNSLQKFFYIIFTRNLKIIFPRFSLVALRLF